MDDTALQSGEYEICVSAGIQKRKKVRLFMPVINCCSSKRRKTSSYDRGGAFNGHHEDLIWEILFRLHPKHVLRFKCVSKRWYAIISNPEFLRNHALRFHHRRHFLQHSYDFLFLPQDGEQDVFLLNLDHQPLPLLSVLPISGVLPVTKGSDLWLVDSCNGLLLYADALNNKNIRGFRCINRTVSIDDDDDFYYLFNPVTKNYVKLPDLKPALLFQEEKDENKTIEYKNLDTRILFDPSVSLSYKVFRFLSRSVCDGYIEIECQCQFYIYSSESDSWKLSTSVPGYVQFASGKGVFLNGVMYWVTTGSDLVCFDDTKTNSVWFQPLPLKPKPKFKHRQPFYFGKCGGRLCLIEKYSRTYGGRCDLDLHDGFDVMEMTEDCRWIKKYHVNVEVNHPHLIAAELKVLHIYKTGNEFKEEEEEEEALLMKINERIVSYRLKSNTFFGKETTIPNRRHPFGYADVHPTSISLFPF